MTQPPDRAAAIEAAWLRERPDLDPSSIRVVTRVWHLAKIFTEHRRRLLAELRLDPALLDLLGTLRRSGEPYALSTRELAEQSLVTRAAVSQRLTRAEAKGWVRRERAGDRSVTVRLTDAGRAVIDAAAGAIFEDEQRLLSDLHAADREHLADVLRQLVQQLDEGGPTH